MTLEDEFKFKYFEYKSSLRIRVIEFKNEFPKEALEPIFL